MKYRTLGKTGLEVSEVGFGGGGIGKMWGDTSDNENLKAIRRAVDLGINFFDCAPMYNNAEELLGETLKEHRHSVFITTKISLLRVEHFDDLRQAIEKSVAVSLKRLQTDYVDILLLHNILSSSQRKAGNWKMTAEDALMVAAEVKELKRAGKVRFSGFTAWSSDCSDVNKLIESSEYDVLQAEYNIMNQSAQESPPPEVRFLLPSESGGDDQIIDGCQSIPKATKYNMGVIGIRPLFGGVLSGAIDRSVEPGSAWYKMLQSAKHLNFLRKGSERTLAQAASIFCLMNSNISTIIPGSKTAKEIDEVASCSGAEPLCAEELTKIDQLYRQNFGIT